VLITAAACTSAVPSVENVGEIGQGIGEGYTDASVAKKCCICRSESRDGGGFPQECTTKLAQWKCDVEIAEVVDSTKACYETPPTFPEGCSTREYYNACHGAAAYCDDYVRQFQSTIDHAGAQCVSVSYDTSACSLAGNLDSFLSEISSVCAKDMRCRIQANQTTVTIDGKTGKPKSSTKVDVCFDKGTTTTYGPCSATPPKCDADLVNQTYKCSAPPNGVQSRVCCKGSGGAYGWGSGSQCAPVAEPGSSGSGSGSGAGSGSGSGYGSGSGSSSGPGEQLDQCIKRVLERDPRAPLESACNWCMQHDSTIHESFPCNSL